MDDWQTAWDGDDTACDSHNVVIFDGETREILGDFHPDNLDPEGVAILPANGTYQGEREGSGWYLGDDGFTRQPPEGDTDG